MDSGRHGAIAGAPAGFEPTPDEKSLLEMYDLVRKYEKKALQLKDEEARAKLRAKEEQFRRERGLLHGEGDDGGGGGGGGKALDPDAVDDVPSPPTKRARRRDDASDDSDASDRVEYDDVGDAPVGADGGDRPDEEDEDARARQIREERAREREAAAERRARAEKEERERAEHLDTRSVADLPSISVVAKKKKPSLSGEVGMDDDARSLMMRSVRSDATPPREFSRVLGLTRSGAHGRLLFPDTSVSPRTVWTPPAPGERRRGGGGGGSDDDGSDDDDDLGGARGGPTDGDFSVRLPDFDAEGARLGSTTGNNTLALKFRAPRDSARFSINVALPDHRDYADVLFHFNPRQRQKGGQLVVNDKRDGIWGKSVTVPLHALPPIFGRPSNTLVVQITGDGFDVYLDGHHIVHLDHRTPLPAGRQNLHLQFPATDDYGSPESWEVYKIWWGHKPLMNERHHGNNNNNSGGRDGGGRVAGFDHSRVRQYHEKKLFINGLAKLQTDQQLDLRQAELERAFRRYGGKQGVQVKVVANTTFAFVEVETERSAEAALQEMQDRYNVQRARKTKLEILKEQREKAIKAKEEQESSEWD